MVTIQLAVTKGLSLISPEKRTVHPDPTPQPASLMVCTLYPILFEHTFPRLYLKRSPYDVVLMETKREEREEDGREMLLREEGQAMSLREV